jgi:hypothetical protein
MDFGGTPMKRIREFLESIVFAGIKPADPLYLTRRTQAQKLKFWSLIAIPCVVLALGVIILSRVLQPPVPKFVKPLTAAEITAKLLPNLDKDIRLLPASDVQVLEVKVEGLRVVGVVKNTATREIAVTELEIELTDAAGSQVGAVSGMVEKIPASGTKDFQIAIQQPNAAFALIRSIKSR